MKVFTITFFLIIFIGCSLGPVPKAILPRDRMQEIVYDLIRVDEYVNNFVIKDTTIDVKNKRSVLYEQVFKVHKSTRQQFNSSFKYYQRHPNLQKELFDSLQLSLTRKLELDKAKKQVH